MVTVEWTYKTITGEKTEVLLKEKYFKPFPCVADAKKWATQKWNFLKWPKGKTVRTGSVKTDGTNVYFIEYSAQNDMEQYVSHYEMNIVSVEKETVKSKTDEVMQEA